MRIARLVGATAVACLAAAGVLPTGASAQSISLEDATSGSADMLLEADTIIYDNDRNTITAVGGVRIDYDGNRLVAQRVTYDRGTSRLIASGNVEIVDPQGTKIYSDEVDVTDDFRDAFVRTLRVETADKTYFAAESAERRGGAVTTFNYGVYTACEPCEAKPDKPPIWRVKAQKIIWNGQTKIVRFERARFEMFGMPLAFLPVFEIADPTVKQKSGFLIPSYRYSDELGHGARVPYYWAVSPTSDVTFKPSWFHKQGFLGEAEWRQRFNSGEYSITIAGIRQQSPEEFYEDVANLDADNSSDNERFRGMIGTKGRFEINPRWTFGWDVLAQTDKNFAHRYDIKGYEQVKRTNQVYLTGLSERNLFDLRFYKFQVQESVTDFYRDTGLPTAARNARQPWVLPSFDYSYTPDAPVMGGELNIDVNLQVVHRESLDHRCVDLDDGPEPRNIPCTSAFVDESAVYGVEGTSGRLTAEAEWKRGIIAPGGLMLTPLLHARGDAIGVEMSDSSVAAIDQTAALYGYDTDIKSSYMRGMATAGLEARWPILFATQSMSHVIEPMAQLFARPDAPYGDTLGIPNEDAQSLVFDASNLFDRDKFAGYDRIEGGVRANLGFRYSGAFGNGWGTNALFGQSFHLAGDNPYASPDLVHAGAFSGLETDRSDYVGSVGLVSPGGLSVAAGGRFDEEDLTLRRTDVSASYSTAPFSASAVYSFIEAQPDYGFATDRQEIRGAASIRLHENWRVFGSATHDLTNDVTVRKSIGFAYDDECFSYAITASEVQDLEGDRSRSLGFRVSLRTIGDFNTTTSLD